MDKLSNSFSLLELDAEDAKEHNLTATIAADGCEARGLIFPVVVLLFHRGRF